MGHDIENRSVTPSKEGLLLSAFCNYDEQVLVIDNTSVDNNEVFTPEILSRCLFIAHNADHEATWGTATNFLPMRYACTMVNSKRLLAGEEGYRFDLVSEINRRLGYKAIPIWMDKDIRNTFHDCQYFINDQILYNAADTIRLKDIFFVQQEIARERNQLYLLNTLNSRIIKPIAITEVRGIRHNTEKWLGIAKERQSRAEIIWKELDQTLKETPGIEIGKINPEIRKKKESLEKRTLRNQERKVKLSSQLQQLEEKNKQHLKSYQLTLKQLESLNSTQELDLQEDGLVNWGSQKQVIEVLKQLGCPLPEAKNKDRKLAPSLKKEARAEWFVKNDSSIHEPFMKQFDSLKKIQHNITSFGDKWVTQYVRNGRIYPSFDQAGTETGRWSSGSKGKKNKRHPNTSQIPAREGAEYRNCFIADEDRLLVTADWKNQEGVLIISLSGDMEMKKITEVSDQHSLLGTRAWRAVYKHRYDQTKDDKWRILADTYVMDKKTPEGEKARNKFKNSAGLFPCLYGAQAHKVAVTSQVTEKEAQIMIDVIKSHAPIADKFLASNRQHGSKYGYVIHNTRSNSRRWFQPVLNQIHYGWKLSNSDKVEVELAAGNSCIQGSGSDLLKEAIAMIALWSSLYKQDIQFVLSNYDEVVYSIPKEKKEQYTKVIEQFMTRSAQNYLIKDVNMECDLKCSEVWEK